MNNGEQFFNTSGGGGYAIERSLRFNSSDSAYLSRTPASAGNRKTWTWAGWVKRSQLSIFQILFGIRNGVSNTDTFYIGFESNDKIVASSNSSVGLTTAAVFRDVSAWMHLCVVADTNQATAANRLNVYVNGAEVTDFDSATYPGQGDDTGINQALLHEIGRFNTAFYYSGYLADVYLIDGQALDPTSFGEFDDNGIWQPIAYSGTYGTNGFHLEFADNSSNTATTLGKDTSGNGNNWTPNNLSVTAGAGNDSLVDVPTNGVQTDTGVGGEVRGNYCTINPLQKSSFATISNGNLSYSGGGSSQQSLCTIGVSSGKWYWEDTKVSGTYGFAGIAKGNANLNTFAGNDAASWGYNKNGNKYHNGTATAYGSTWDSGDNIGIAFDADAGTLTFYKNGVSQGTAFTGLTSGPYFPSCCDLGTVGVINFGQRPFAYPFSGFKALCTANLPAPVVTKPSSVFDVLLYTGTGSSRSITGLDFNPDLVWQKPRSEIASHRLVDSVRGVDQVLKSNLTNAEATEDGVVDSFDSNGFTGGGLNAVNSGQTAVAWCWDAGSSTVTNTQGSITSSVRANASAGFSMVTWTAASGNPSTLGHGLNAIPEFVITKTRTATNNWAIYHKSLGSFDRLLRFNTSAYLTSSGYWGTSNEWTSSTFCVFPTANVGDNNWGDMVAYCFAPVDGYSSFGSYTGNGSTDGPFIYTGFRPKWILVKNTTAAESWWITDSARDTYNVAQNYLAPNLSNSEGASAVFDFLSNGFKLRTTFTSHNGNTNPIIYAAFAENPFALNARAR